MRRVTTGGEESEDLQKAPSFNAEKETSSGLTV